MRRASTSFAYAMKPPVWLTPSGPRLWLVGSPECALLTTMVGRFGCRSRRRRSPTGCCRSLDLRRSARLNTACHDTRAAHHATLIGGTRRALSRGRKASEGDREKQRGGCGSLAQWVAASIATEVAAPPVRRSTVGEGRCAGLQQDPIIGEQFQPTSLDGEFTRANQQGHAHLQIVLYRQTIGVGDPQVSSLRIGDPAAITSTGLRAPAT